MRKYAWLSVLLLVAIAISACGGGAAPATTAPAQTQTTTAPAAPASEKAKLVIESWRNDDLTIWQDQIIPAFNQKYPDIEVVFQPAAPADNNGVLKRQRDQVRIVPRDRVPRRTRRSVASG